MLPAKLLQPLTRIDQHGVGRSDDQPHIIIDPERLPRNTEECLFLDQRRAKVDVRLVFREMRDIDPEQEVHRRRGKSAVEPGDPGEAVVRGHGVVLELVDDFFEPRIRGLVQDLGKRFLDDTAGPHDPVSPAVKGMPDGVGVVCCVVQDDPAESPSWEEEAF